MRQAPFKDARLKMILYTPIGLQTMIAEIKSKHNQSTTHRNHGDQISWLPGRHGSRCHAGLVAYSSLNWESLECEQPLLSHVSDMNKICMFLHGILNV